jgi:endonuclease VIII-like 1
MPELAELRLTADFINRSATGMKFVNIQKNPVHKGLDIECPFSSFKVFAESRGKELIVTLKDNHSTECRKLLMTMGMSGRFSYTNSDKEPKHAHLKFYTDDGTTLSFVDVRRFGKWKWTTDWSKNRGPDPTTEFEQFKENILNVGFTKALFEQPIHVVLMNQQYFNGIGNYLRAEILYRVNIHPMIPAKLALVLAPELFDLCRDIPLQAYALGGGQLKDWENPFKSDPEPFRKFIRCYGNSTMSRVRDKNGRMFWYDPKWDSKNTTYTPI